MAKESPVFLPVINNQLKLDVIRLGTRTGTGFYFFKKELDLELGSWVCLYVKLGPESRDMFFKKSD